MYGTNQVIGQDRGMKIITCSYCNTSLEMPEYINEELDKIIEEAVDTEGNTDTVKREVDE